MLQGAPTLAKKTEDVFENLNISMWEVHILNSDFNLSFDFYQKHEKLEDEIASLKYLLTKFYIKMFTYKISFKNKVK